ncbi:MAG: hypothetical protein Kow0080_35190 [Candidatus Promineifilaceae bacterium]
MRRFWFWGIVMLLLLPAQAAYAEKSYHAQQFDVDIVVEEGGSLLITETVVFQFVGEPFTFAFREIPVDLTDGLELISAKMDGRSFSPGTNPGQVEIEQGNPLRVTWHFEPTANATRTFTLTYRLLGVVQQTDKADLLLYQPLPDEFEYTIDQSSITVHYPGTAVTPNDVAIQAGRASIIVHSNKTIMTSQNLEPNQTLVFAISFPPGAIISQPPSWQAERAARLARQQAAMPWWLTASSLVIAVGVWVTSRIYKKHKVALPKKTQPAYEPPQTMPPALAGVLQVNSGKANWTHALAAMYDLAERGFLVIEELPKKKWYQGQNFVVRQAAQPDGLKPHEEALWQLIFTDRKGQPEQEVKLSDLAQRVTGKRWRAFQDVVKAELKQVGWWSENRYQARQGLMIAGVVLLLLSPLVMMALALNMDYFGAWSFTLAGALFVVGLLAVVFADGIRPFTDDAVHTASQWLGFKEYLKQLSKGKAAMTRPDIFDLYLPYAAAFGVLYPWVKRLEKEGYEQVPAFFQAASDNQMSAFVAAISASSSSGGAAGAAGTAGAAGGGASGAG